MEHYLLQLGIRGALSVLRQPLNQTVYDFVLRGHVYFAVTKNQRKVLHWKQLKVLRLDQLTKVQSDVIDDAAELGLDMEVDFNAQLSLSIRLWDSRLYAPKIVQWDCSKNYLWLGGRDSHVLDLDWGGHGLWNVLVVDQIHSKRWLVLHPRPCQQTQNRVLIKENLRVSSLHLSIEFLSILKSDLALFVIQLLNEYAPVDSFIEKLLAVLVEVLA